METTYEPNYQPAAKLILLAPVIFILHVIEEAPGLVAWFNAHFVVAKFSFYDYNSALHFNCVKIVDGRLKTTSY
jgi:hypothetical protein